jgi:integrase
VWRPHTHSLRKPAPILGVQPGRHFDGRGLYLEVTAAGGRYWRMKYRHAGKEKRLSFGVYPEVSLKQARERCAEAHKTLDLGADPGQIKKTAKALSKHEARTTFQAVAQGWLDHMRGKWAAETHRAIRASFAADVFPAIGARPMAQMKPREVAQVVKAVEARGAGDVAGRIFQRIRAVFSRAVVHELIPSNPMLDLKASALLKPRQVTHRAALDDKLLPGFLTKLDAYDGDPTTKHALRLLMLTAVRPGELRGARWSEIDTAQAVWRIPGERMKMRLPHVVPLSRQALDVLEAMRPISGHRDLVFPSPYYPGKTLSENTLNSALARLGFKGIATAHGMRALFSTVANECGHNSDVIERQLAHRERNEVRAAYHRSAYMQDRAKLMQWWADYIDGRRGGVVVPLGLKASA